MQRNGYQDDTDLSDEALERQRRREQRRQQAADLHAQQYAAEQRRAQRVEAVRRAAGQGRDAVRRTASGIAERSSRQTAPRDPASREAQVPVRAERSAAPSRPSPAAQGRQPLLIGIAVVAVVLIAVIALVVSSCSKPKEDTTEQSTIEVQTLTAANDASAPSDTSSDATAVNQPATPVAQAANVSRDGLHPRSSNEALSVTASIAGIEPPAGYQGVEDPWLPGGYYTTGDPELDEYVKQWCDAQTKEGLDFSDNAYNTYLSIAWSDYEERDDAQSPSGHAWMYTYAKQYYLHSGGNCYEFSAFLSFCMQYFGYSDAYVEAMLILFEGGAWGQHALVFLTNHDGSQCFLDTARGANGWMLPVGTYTYQVDDIGQNIVDPFTYTAPSASGSGSANVPDPAWKTAAGVPELTSSGTDPTAIAAQMEADRIAANLASGYRGVEDPWVDSGYFTTGDQELDQLVKEFCDSHTSPDLDFSDNAYSTFCNITWSDYDEWEGNQYPRTYDWTVQYAKDFFQRGGNCFSMAAAIQYCLRYFGYSDAHAEITYQERQSGIWLDHGLNWVTNVKTGEIRLVDSEMAANGWMMAPNSYNVEVLDPTSDWEPRSTAFNIGPNAS